jgi:hypothetical protein
MYKKILQFTLLSIITSATIIQSTATTKAFTAQTPFGSFPNFGEFVQGLLDWGQPAIASLAVLMFIWAGFLYMTSKGDQANITVAKDIMTATIVGLVLLFTAGVLLKGVVGMK